MNITDWGSRAVPNVLLTSALPDRSGVWNAAALLEQEVRRGSSKSFLGAIALKDQRKYARQIETILLHDTPVIFPYFYNYLAAGSKPVKGYEADAAGPGLPAATPRSA